MTTMFYCTNCGRQLYPDNKTKLDYVICPGCQTKVLIPPEIRGKLNLDNSEISAQAKSSAKVFPTIGQSLLVILALFALLIILYIPVVFVRALANIPSGNDAFSQAITTLIAFGIVLFGGLKLSKSSFKEVFPLRRFNFVLIIPIIIIVVGSTILLSDIDNLVRMAFPAPEWITRVFQELFENTLKAIIVAVIVAPLTEEFLMRGLILHGFLKNYSVNKAIIVSAVLFTVMHLNPWQFAGAFFYGILFAWFLVQTKSLIPCLIGHATANFMPLLIIHILGLNIPGFTEGAMNEIVLQPWWFDLIGLALTAIGFFWLKRHFSRNSQPETVQI